MARAGNICNSLHKNQCPLHTFLWNYGTATSCCKSLPRESKTSVFTLWRKESLLSFFCGTLPHRLTNTSQWVEKNAPKIASWEILACSTKRGQMLMDKVQAIYTIVYLALVVTCWWTCMAVAAEFHKTWIKHQSVITRVSYILVKEVQLFDGFAIHIDLKKGQCRHFLGWSRVHEGGYHQPIHRGGSLQRPKNQRSAFCTHPLDH